MFLKVTFYTLLSIRPVACAISAMPDEGLFFQNPLHTTLFRFTVGILMKECHNHCMPKETTPLCCDNQKE